MDFRIADTFTDSLARLTGDETLASNGVVQPVDALLVRPAAAAAS